MADPSDSDPITPSDQAASSDPGSTPPPPAPRRSHLARNIILAVIALVVLAGLIALPIFQPWKLFVDRTVDEALPGAAPAATGSPLATGTPGATTQPPAPSEPVTLATGAFFDQEHATSGTATIYRLGDGRRILRLTDFETSDGPDVQVWLTDQNVPAGSEGWYVFDDGAYTNLGPLKGNIGDQNYEIPDEVDLATVRSVSIWCARFSVSFGAAELSAA